MRSAVGVAVLALTAASTIPLAAQQLSVVSVVSDTGAVHAAMRGIVQVLAPWIAEAAIAPQSKPWRVQLPDSGRPGWLPVRPGLVGVLRARAVTRGDRTVGLIKIEPVHVRGDSLFVSFLVGESRLCNKRWTEQGMEFTVAAVRKGGQWANPVLIAPQLAVDDFC